MRQPIVCIECGSPLVVNKHFKLCQYHNELRLNGGKTKQQVYEERRNQTNSNRLRTLPDKDGIRSDGSKSNPDISELKKQYSIRAVSSANHYRCSDGSLVTQVEIKRNLANVYDKIDGEREHVCQGTGRWDVPLSHSHTISQARCKELGKTELIWDKDNIELEGFEAPTSNPEMAHNIWEVGNLEKKKTLINFTKKLAYIKKHDPQTYAKLTM